MDRRTSSVWQADTGLARFQDVVVSRAFSGFFALKPNWRLNWLKFPSSTLAAIQCPQPAIPLNGKIDGTSGAFGQRRYAVGALLTFSCNEGNLLVGEGSIVCTETGFWSHAPPICKCQTQKFTHKSLKIFKLKSIRSLSSFL